MQATSGFVPVDLATRPRVEHRVIFLGRTQSFTQAVHSRAAQRFGSASNIVFRQGHQKPFCPANIPA